MEVTLAVKEIVEFLYSTANLTNDINTDSIGSKIHSFWQSKYKKGDIKEYYVKNTFEINDCKITLQGFIDGLLDNGHIIEEIKTSFIDLNEVIVKREHLAQAKFYAYMYLLESPFTSIDIRITYIHFETKEFKSFDYTFKLAELKKFFNESMDEYVNWLLALDNHSEDFINSIKDLPFPFETYRTNQKEFIQSVNKNLIEKNILFAIAPTGVGKTVSTLFPAIKNVNNKNDKIFYLTAKTSGKKVALDTIEMLINKGGKIKAIELTAKEKMCAMQAKICNPEVCPFMQCYFGKLKEAIYDIYSNNDIFDRQAIYNCAIKHEVCPFEFSLDLSRYADIIIGDYNYAFDPKTHLLRYFDTDDYNHILLVDEAHNLVNRAKEMYSATITLDDIDFIDHYIAKVSPSIHRLTKAFNNFAYDLDHEFYYEYEVYMEFIDIINKIVSKVETVLATEKGQTVKDNVLPYYFNLKTFLKIYEFYDSDFRFVVDNDKFSIKCMDASKFIKNTLDTHSFSSVFFSATMYPLDYYKNLITMNEGNEETINSPFDPSNLLLIIRRNTSTKYNVRQNSVFDIIDCINEMVKYKVGNYIVFFPSYEYLYMVISTLNNPDYECIVQSKNLTDDEKESILEEFNTHDTTKVGFFVMGGVFAEGIDYLGDMLSGVMIVSVSLPPFDNYNEMLKSYFDDVGKNGLNYAYQIPAMNKVIQSVGRLIRSETDTGVAILYDDRFAYPAYKAMLPRFWSNIKYASDNAQVSKYISLFKKQKNG